MDWIQFPFEVDAVLHRGAGAPTVRLRWVYTDQPFLPVGTNSVILNRVWDDDQVTDLTVGQVPLVECDYKQDARWRLPALAFTGHLCHPEWLSVGEPWPVPPDLPPTVRLDGWIPECCVMCCEFIGCSVDPVNDAPASQHLQYAGPAKDATGTTPTLISQVGDALGGTGPDVRGASVSYHPLGRDGVAGYALTPTADAAGVMQDVTEKWRRDDDNRSTRVLDVDGQTWTTIVGAVQTQMTLRVVDGIGELCGTNLKICPDILPDGVQISGFSIKASHGVNASDAEPITTSVTLVQANVLGGGVRLPPMGVGGAGVYWVTVLTPSLTTQAVVYPAPGENINGLGIGVGITVARGSGLLCVQHAGRLGGWLAIPY